MMHVWREGVPERESEFTGTKGFILKYAGTAYALILLSQFCQALAALPVVPDEPLNVASYACFALAFVAYPAFSLCSRSSSINPTL